jgi:hypothetical protein
MSIMQVGVKKEKIIPIVGATASYVAANGSTVFFFASYHVHACTHFPMPLSYENGESCFLLFSGGAQRNPCKEKKIKVFRHGDLS